LIAPSTSRSIRIFLKQVSITVFTSPQLSRRTVCLGGKKKDEVEAPGGKTRGPAHLDTLGVHLVVGFGLGPVESRVPLLVDKEIGEVDFLEFELDGPGELRGDKGGRLESEGHDILHVVISKLHHHRVGVTIDDHSVMRIAVRDLVLFLDELATNRRQSLREKKKKEENRAATVLVLSIIWRPKAVTLEEICRQGSLPTVAPVKP